MRMLQLDFNSFPDFQVAPTVVGRRKKSNDNETTRKHLLVILIF